MNYQYNNFLVRNPKLNNSLTYSILKSLKIYLKETFGYENLDEVSIGKLGSDLELDYDINKKFKGIILIIYYYRL